MNDENVTPGLPSRALVVFFHSVEQTVRKVRDGANFLQRFDQRRDQQAADPTGHLFLGNAGVVPFAEQVVEIWIGHRVKQPGQHLPMVRQYIAIVQCH